MNDPNRNHPVLFGDQFGIDIGDHHVSCIRKFSAGLYRDREFHEPDFACSDIRSIITTDPFYIKLVFGSKEQYSGTYRNTIEYLTATLTTSTVPTTVPEPTSIVLHGSGLIALGARRARR